MKKRRIGLLWLIFSTFLISYVIMCIFLMDKTPFNVILPFGLLAIIILFVIIGIVSLYWVAKNNMLMFENNKIYENEKSMFFFDLMLGTCYQVIKKGNIFFFVKIGNGIFAIKEERICKDVKDLDEQIRRKKVRMVHIKEIMNIKFIVGTHTVDLIRTYKYSGYTIFSSAWFTKTLQSVFDADEIIISKFFSKYDPNQQPDTIVTNI